MKLLEVLKENPIILALDGMNREQALRVTEEMKDVIGGVKVNDLLDKHGTSIVKDLKKLDVVVMADPKISDVPRTNARRIGHYVDAGADIVTVHATNSMEALKAVVERCKGTNTEPIAVTVLTSIDRYQCAFLYGRTPRIAVPELAEHAGDSGLSLLVCSPLETRIIRDYSDLTYSMKIINPGIRAVDMDAEDQKRVNTPAGAIKAGADGLVIGSMILNAGKENKEDPMNFVAMRDVAEDTLAEIREARG